MDKQQAVDAVYRLLRLVREREASDLFITAGFPPALRINGRVEQAGQRAIGAEAASLMVRSLMNDKQLREFDETKECNFAIYPQGIGRFRVSLFIQQGRLGAVLRRITTEIPALEDLGLPAGIADIAMAKRGLALVVGATGSGKSTTLAAMIQYRNTHSQGHIITVEDPVEFLHRHAKSIVTQREVGIDTRSWGDALKSALRQSPDVMLIGEIRDPESMAYAMQFAETGHLCLATLHANSANQAIERILNFYPEGRHPQIFLDLAANLRAIVSQRLVRRADGHGRLAAMDIMLNSPLVGDLIAKGQIASIRDVMAKSKERGMITFDQCLFDLYESGRISMEEALRNADSHNELRLRIKLESRRGASEIDTSGLGLVDEARDNPGQSLRRK